MSFYYCETCGQKSTNLKGLISAKCKNHPNGAFKGNHKLYEGSVKPKYACKLCGATNVNLAGLVSAKCKNHPDGTFKGLHQPAL